MLSTAPLRKRSTSSSGGGRTSERESKELKIELNSELWTPAEKTVGRNGVRRLSESPDSHAPASRQHRRNCRRCSAAETQILNQPVELKVRSSEISFWCKTRHAARIPGRAVRYPQAVVSRVGSHPQPVVGLILASRGGGVLHQKLA